MDAFEQAYKNGFAAGLKAAEEKIVRSYKNGYDAGRRDAEGRIVRCKECVHYNVYRLECHNKHMNGINGIDGFCSYGERREDG
jgi:hypothetical protein